MWYLYPVLFSYERYVIRATAAVAVAPHEPFQLREVELEEPRAHEIVVDIKACGICHTDLSVRDQRLPTPLPAVLGHEGAGIVTAVGSDVSEIRPGDRVGLSYHSCGHCPTCLGGVPAHCHRHFPLNFAGVRADGSTGITADGEALHSHFFGQSSFATRGLADVRTAFVISDDPFEIVAPFGCGIQTGAGTVLNVLRPEAGSSIAVFGVGTVGISALLAAAIAGCEQIIAVDVNTERLALASELGATDVVDAGTTDAVEAIRELTKGGAHFAIDCTGVPAVLAGAVAATAPLGTTAIVGSPPAGSQLSLDIIEMIVSGKTVVGAAEGRSVPSSFIPLLLDHWREGRFPVDRLMQTFPFEQIDEAAHLAETGRVIKPVLVMPGA